MNETDKHFKQLVMGYDYYNGNYNNNIVLNDSSFWDITFDEFYGYNMKLISNNAFGKAAQTIKLFVAKRFNHQPPLYDVWKVLNSLVNVETLGLKMFITEIPSQAFMPLKGKQSKLKLVSFESHNSLTIKKMAFSNLDNLNNLHFETDFDKVESEAFAINNGSSEKLTITFAFPINGHVFQQKSFVGLQRSVEIRFSGNVNYIPESSFKTILDNPNNNLTFRSRSISANCTINCFDCKNVWMIRDQKDKQVIHAKCNHNNSLTLFHSQVQHDLLRKCQTNFILNL